MVFLNIIPPSVCIRKVLHHPTDRVVEILTIHIN